MKSFIRRCLPLSVAFLATMALAAEPPSPSVAVTRAWSRATVPGASVGAAYFEVINSGPPDVLLAIESPVAKHVEMHSMTMNAGMMQMRPVPSVDIPAKGRVVFGPEGLHAMLVDLTQPLHEGGRIPLTLVFRHAGRVPVSAVVQGLGAMTPPAAEGVTSDRHS